MSNHSPLVIPSVAEGSAVRLARMQKSRESSEGPAVSLPGTYTPSLALRISALPIPLSRPNSVAGYSLIRGKPKNGLDNAKAIF